MPAVADHKLQCFLQKLLAAEYHLHMHCSMHLSSASPLSANFVHSCTPSMISNSVLPDSSPGCAARQLFMSAGVWQGCTSHPECSGHCIPLRAVGLDNSTEGGSSSSPSSRTHSQGTASSSTVFHTVTRQLVSTCTDEPNSCLTDHTLQALTGQGPLQYSAKLDLDAGQDMCHMPEAATCD